MSRYTFVPNFIELQQKLREEIDFWQSPKIFNKFGRKRLKIEKIKKNRLLEDLRYRGPVQIHVHAKFLTKSKNLDKFGRKRVKIHKIKIPASRGLAYYHDTFPFQISLSYAKNSRSLRLLIKNLTPDDGWTDDGRTDGRKTTPPYHYLSFADEVKRS